VRRGPAAEAAALPPAAAPALPPPDWAEAGAVEETDGGALSAALGGGARPRDIALSGQWHFTSAGGQINLRDAWADFTGRGVSVAVVDDGFDISHADLRANYNQAIDWDWRNRDADASWAVGDNHGTAVMGLIGADANGFGTVGVAHDASVAGLRIGYGVNGNASQYAGALRDGARFDVVNSSWGYADHFRDNFNLASFASSEAALAHGAAAGRGGLGTLYVFSAGNARGTGDNVNHHNYQNNIWTIATAATDSAGRVAAFSTPGAALLVSAPGVGVATTDISGTSGYGRGDTVAVSGTSFAAPIVSGVAALMLDANAALGWRDVHEILAYSARFNDPGRATWQFNDASDFNGGGLRTSTDYGFGLVDVHAALRLAETWTQQSTSANLLRASASAAPNLAVADGGVATSSLFIGADLRMDRIELALDLRHGWRGDLRVTLIGPGGTESVLINRPGGTGNGADNIVFDLGSTQFWGESSRGTWSLRVEDLARNGEAGTLARWRLEVMGDARSPDNTYIYTDDFATLGADAARRVLSDASGVDAINASAVTTASAIDLASGATIAGRAVTFAAGTVIERAFAGDGADVVRGNAAANWIWGGRGDDVLAGRDGADVFAFGVRSGADRIEDFEVGDVVWLMDGVGLAGLAGSVATLSDGATLTALNGWQWSTADFLARSGWLGA